MKRLDGLDFVCYFSGERVYQNWLKEKEVMRAINIHSHCPCTQSQTDPLESASLSGTVLAGKQGEEGSLARLTGCWSPEYEFYSWSNVVCIRRDHEMYPHAERLSMRYAKHRSLYYWDEAMP